MHGLGRNFCVKESMPCSHKFRKGHCCTLKMAASALMGSEVIKLGVLMIVNEVVENSSMAVLGLRDKVGDVIH